MEAAYRSNSQSHPSYQPNYQPGPDYNLQKDLSRVVAMVGICIILLSSICLFGHYDSPGFFVATALGGTMILVALARLCDHYRLESAQAALLAPPAPPQPLNLPPAAVNAPANPILRPSYMQLRPNLVRETLNRGQTLFGRLPANAMTTHLAPLLDMHSHANLTGVSRDACAFASDMRRNPEQWQKGWDWNALAKEHRVAAPAMAEGNFPPGHQLREALKARPKPSGSQAPAAGPAALAAAHQIPAFPHPT